VASAFGVELRPVGVRDAGEIERADPAFACEPNGGLIVPASPLSIVQRDLIITLAARHRLPAVYSLRFFVTSGGLISYGPDTIEPYRRAPRTLTASSRARNRPTCPCRRRPSTSW
jgi:putative ABC transport system substrate-binding protein